MCSSGRVMKQSDKVALNNFVIEMQNEQSECIVMYLFVTVCVMCNVQVRLDLIISIVNVIYVSVKNQGGTL